MAEEEADAAAFFAGKEQEIERPNDAQWPPWAGYLYQAWQTLRDDRHYGSMGGLGRIYFTAIERYAERHEIDGSAFDDFLLFVRVIDDEYVAVVNEKMKSEQNKRDGNHN